MRSEIVTHDLATGAETVVLAHDARVEAPNWTRDGTALIVNAAGRLYRVALDAPALAPIDTGPLRWLNNDHGPSPDGRWLAVSDKTETGKAAIYVLPADGGAPRRVTPRVPSWWHAWSPDGARLAYAAQRGRGVQIHTCAVDGTDERALTDGFDHCDGPDYAPDGEWIWFNGERLGAVDLWRMRPDGADLARMTGGPTIDWFPHPSPDGAHVLYLAYPPGTIGHPADRPVTLRLMPSGGGAGRVLARFRGGQGTSNVPCWSPDGRAFAYVRYPPDDAARPSAGARSP